MRFSDGELVARAQAGDTGAFEALVERHREALVRLVRGFVPCADDAHDLAQDAVLSAFQHLGALRDGEKFAAWLCRIAVNAARQWRRHEAQISFEPLWDDEAPDQAAGRAADTSAQRLREIVRDALAGLPPDPRSAVLLHYFDGYDYAEAAALLDVPVSTVRGRLYVARRRLREEMIELARPKAKPAPPQAPAVEFALTADDLDALRGAAAIASRDPARLSIQGVCIEPDGTLVSTDTHRLFLSRGSSIRPPERVVVSRAVLDPLALRPYVREARLATAAEEATLRFVDERDAGREHAQRAPLLEADRFPHYDRVIPTESRITASLSVRDLEVALDEVGRFEAFLSTAALPDRASEGIGVSLLLSGDEGRIVTHDAAVRAGAVPARWALDLELRGEVEGLKGGEEFRVAINRRYLRACAPALGLGEEERLEVRVTEPLLPIVVKPAGRENRFVVVMPLLPDVVPA